MSHTPGKLRIGTPPPNGEQTIGTEQGLMVAVATTGIDMPTKANARRLVAAWNACIGASTEDLEKHGFLALRTRQVESLEAERDALREVNARLVEFIDEYVDAFENCMAGDSYLLRMARAALARANELRGAE